VRSGQVALGADDLSQADQRQRQTPLVFFLPKEGYTLLE
jgi:hypothetical protein